LEKENSILLFSVLAQPACSPFPGPVPSQPLQPSSSSQHSAQQPTSPLAVARSRRQLPWPSAPAQAEASPKRRAVHPLPLYCADRWGRLVSSIPSTSSYAAWTLRRQGSPCLFRPLRCLAPQATSTPYKQDVCALCPPIQALGSHLISPRRRIASS